LAGGSPQANARYQGTREPTEEDCKPVFDKIEQWKKDLLDLTRRNRLLYLTDKKAEKLVGITSPSLQELFDALVVRDSSLRFPMPVFDQLTLGDPALEGKAGPEVSIRRGDLETSLPITDLHRNLGRLKRDLHSSQEEQGIHTLFLAAGFLRWKEKPYPGGEDEEYLAPIVLVPVGLDRKSAEDQFSIKLSEEDIVVNPALQFKLSAGFGITLSDLPNEPDGSTVEAYLKGIEQAITVLGWRVTREVRLGKFTYEKFVMFNDLTENRMEGCRNPIIRALATSKTTWPKDEIELPHDLDEVVDPNDIFPLLDADSSQMEVLLRFRRGQNLVVQGPPGTGKSQTIANLISQGLRDGKKILFVSEKMAALEVVNRRLKASGLSFACLEVHSHKSDKLKVVQELAKTLTESQAQSVGQDASEQYRKLIRLRDHLNSYVKELHKPRGGLKLSAFQVHGKLSRLLDAPRVEFKLPANSGVQMTLDQYDELLGALGRIEHIGDVFDNLEGHPWGGTEPRTSDDSGLPLDPSIFVDDVMANLGSLRSALPRLHADALAPATRMGVGPPTSIERMEGFLRLLKLLSAPRVVADSWARLSTEELNHLIADANALKALHQRLKEKRSLLRTDFDLDLLKLPVEQMLARFTREYRTVFRFLKSDYRRDMKTLHLYRVSTRQMGYDVAAKALATAKEILDAQTLLQTGYTESKAALSPSYQGEETDWNSTIGGLEWLSQVSHELGQPNLPNELSGLIKGPDQLSRFADGAMEQLNPILASVLAGVNKLSSALKSYTIEGGGLKRASFPALEAWLGSKSNPEDLRNWLSYQKAKANCHKLGLTEFLTAAKENHIPAKDLARAFLQRMWKTWLAEVYRESPVLSDFTATSHEQVILEFRDIDRKLKGLTIDLVRQTISRSQPKDDGSTAQGSQRGIILHEAQKKRRVKPLRRVFAEAPHIIRELKPCMLMSPLSVASYLGTSPYRFDWVIFDEASQIPPADAIGSILRGSHLIVAGDDKQLPPTTFFQAGADFEDETDEDFEEPLESILDECLALPGFRKVSLKWHYRSKREELIDFSNKRFYDGGLVTFPSPDSRGAPAAVEFCLVDGGVYDRGGSRKNLQEAGKVCDLIEEHFRQYGPGSSLGVITLSMAQEEAIQDEFDRRKMLDPDLSAVSDSNVEEPFFVKALERVQGDERDRIIISLGYGKDANGVLTMNFGPINKGGGERRLNVAITRAREKVILVSSFRPQEMDLARLSTTSRGVRILAEYLEYASQGGRFPAQTYGGGEPESDFEYDVRERLAARGLKVDSQVGCSGFRIDLAIRHPQHDDRYILGIECDGATYHSHRSARDRDKLRQEVLEKLGWKILRVWSTDWVKNPDRIVVEISSKVQDLLEQDGVSAAESMKPNNDAPGNAGTSQGTLLVDGSDPSRLGRSQDPPLSPSHGFGTYLEYRPRGGRPNDVQSLIQAIVEQESPIHVDALVRRVAMVYGITKVGSRTKRNIWSHIQQSYAHRRILMRGSFCWVGNTVTPRVPRPGEPPRPVDEIALEELEAAARAIVAKEKGIPRESLIKTVGQALGYGRIGTKVDKRIDLAIEQQFKKGQFSNYEGQVILTPHPDGSESGR